MEKALDTFGKLIFTFLLAAVLAYVVVGWATTDEIQSNEPHHRDRVDPDSPLNLSDDAILRLHGEED